MHDNAPMKEVTYPIVAIIGAGAMGRGIAQIAAQAGSNVRIFDTQPAAVIQARDALFLQWDKLQEKGRLTPEAVADNKARIHAVTQLTELAD